MIAENQIRQALARYLRGEVSLDRFEDWLVQHSWNMHLDSEEAAQKLAGAVELRLAEYSSRHLEEPALKDELRQFVNPAVVQISFGEASTRFEIGPANNAIAEPRPQVVVFTSRSVASQEVSQERSFLGGAVFSGKEQLVGSA